MSQYRELREHYVLHETLGSGGFAKVKAGVHKLTGEKVAIKIMDKELLGSDLPRAFREIKALKKLHHQHISQLFQVIETQRMIYLIIEFCPGGELFDYIVAKERLKEKEARAFFRQIVSALKYIHSAGFVHRDLKPENLLLDDDSNIKLIDFGLVSEPEINVTGLDCVKLLETCCGSPAYAAPELIKGGPYVGPRADIWSLGVLLYALLNGFLPFDDDHTPRLYQLIQQGEYEIPEWLTPGSVGMISRLLQTNPLERITVDALMKDSWVQRGYGKSVDWKSRVNVSELDAECVTEMARHFQQGEESMCESILEWKYGEVTATYLLLVQKKNRGYAPTIVYSPRMPRNQSGSTNDSSASSVSTSDFPLAYVSQIADPASDTATPAEPEVPVFTQLPAPVPSVRTRRISLGQQNHPPPGELLTLQRLSKAPHPAISAIQDAERMSEPASPKKKKPPHLPVGPTPSMPISQTSSMYFNEQAPQSAKVPKTQSFESRLQYAVEDQKAATLQNGSPKPRRTRIGSFDFLNKVKKVFRRPSETAGTASPRKVKGVYDISTTSRKDTQEVMEELEHALTQLNVNFKKEGYVMKCSVNSHKMSTNHRGKMTEIKFELEVCLLPRLEMLGVRRKRIRGDVWEFKRVCDLIFKATHL
ncbi:maternal embryonic leucine zipper kinase-like [Halichondria panicea]|uniref:maternal embryonic leucine zipper kinase-like n=1 Tax=Halichondria panicea TaxID=6063 RepID=UPI00312B2E28